LGCDTGRLGQLQLLRMVLVVALLLCGPLVVDTDLCVWRRMRMLLRLLECGDDCKPVLFLALLPVAHLLPRSSVLLLCESELSLSLFGDGSLPPQRRLE
jgi:hypothetical protein